MRLILSFIIFFCGIGIAHSQTIDYNDTTAVFASESIKITYSPSDLISNLSVFVKKYSKGGVGIKISFITKPKDRALGIKVDSITLRSTNDKTLLIEYNFVDTIFTTDEGGLKFKGLYILDKQSIDLIKNEMIKNIILTINKEDLIINIRKKSQRELQEMAKLNF